MHDYPLAGLQFGHNFLDRGFDLLGFSIRINRRPAQNQVLQRHRVKQLERVGIIVGVVSC